MDKKKAKHGTIILLLIAIMSLATAGVLNYYARNAKAVIADSSQAVLHAPAAETLTEGMSNFDAEMYNNEEYRLFYNIVTADLENKYPDIPEAVMDFYDDTTMLLYSGTLSEPEMVEAVIRKQRQLYAPELLQLNPLDAQLEKLIASIEESKKRNIHITKMEHVSMDYDPEDEDMFIVNGIMRLDGEADLYYNYYIKKYDDGRYRIILIDPVNRYFQS